MSADPAPAETIDTPSPSADNSSGPAMPVHLVEGSTPHLTSETQGVLRGRLRASALLLFGGFAVFLVYDLFHMEYFNTPCAMAVFWAHVVVTVITGTMGMMLCRHCSISLLKLRIAEGLIFGGPAIFFALMMLNVMGRSAPLGYVSPNAGPWTMLIFTYALFIPNTWQRALSAIGPIAEFYEPDPLLVSMQ